MSTAPSLAPTAATERIGMIDALRGFALLGILLVNMALFIHPPQTAAYPIAHNSGLDTTIHWLIRFLAESKFYSLFSMLFGFGFVLQWQRAQARGRSFTPVYLRRSLALLVIGLLHGILLWVGDILAIYAVLGLLLLLFNRLRPRGLLIWASVLVLLPALFLAATTGLTALGSQDPAVAAQIDAALAESAAITQARIAEGYQIYTNGSFAEITARRMTDLVEMGTMGIFLMPNVLAMFLVGAAIAKRDILRDLPGHRALFQRMLIWGGSAGLLLNFVYATLTEGADRTLPTWPLVAATAAQAIGAPLLTLAYASALALLWLSPTWQPRLARWLAPTGRMALTNYLMQSVIATTIFYGYGLGLFGQVSAAVGLLLTFAIYGLELWWSPRWLARFRFGPVEWLWRTLTYLRPQPLRGPATGGSHE